MKVKKWMGGSCVFLGVVLQAVVSMGSQADTLASSSSLNDVEQAIGLYQAELEKAPSYDNLWKLARATNNYADQAQRQDLPKWKALNKKFGKQGMDYAARAREINPNGVEGHYYYALNVGKYADGVSILTALREGLKNSTQEALEAAYRIDKGFDQGGPAKALGRFWFVLPWPMQDGKKSLAYLEEQAKIAPEDPQGQFFLAETLLDGKNKDRARGLLNRVAKSSDDYYARKASTLLSQN